MLLCPGQHRQGALPEGDGDHRGRGAAAGGRGRVPALQGAGTSGRL
jgi:hypothetical protein